MRSELFVILLLLLGSAAVLEDRISIMDPGLVVQVAGDSCRVRSIDDVDHRDVFYFIIAMSEKRYITLHCDDGKGLYARTDDLRVRYTSRRYLLLYILSGLLYAIAVILLLCVISLSIPCLAWRWVKQNRKTVAAVGVIFLLSAVAGFYRPVDASDIASALKKLPAMKRIYRSDATKFTRIFSIFYNNYFEIERKCLKFGIFLLPIFVIAGINGYLLGSMLSHNHIRSLILVLPHGLVEVPALVLHLSANLYLFLSLYSLPRWMRSRRWQDIRKVAVNYASLMVLTFFMLLAAAFLEVIVTPAVYFMYLSMG